MNWKKFALSALLGCSLVITGCGDDDTGTEDTGTPTDTGGGGEDTGGSADCSTGDSRFYVVDTISVPEIMGSTVDGFNLDELVSDESDPQGCFIEDFTAPDGRTGVDNQLAELAPILATALMTDLSTTIQEAINSGSIVLLAEVTGVDDIANDDCVTMNLYLGLVPGDGAPMVSGGTLTAGQTFDINEVSLMGGNPLISIPNVTIDAGTLQAGPVNLPLMLDIGGTALTLTVRAATLRVDVTDTTISNGTLGGELNIDELIMAVDGIGGDLDPMIVRSTLESVADLQPDAGGVCQAVSAGLNLTGVEAVRGEVRAAPAE